MLTTKLRRVGLLMALTLFGCSPGEEPQRLHTDRPPPVPSGSVAVMARIPLLPTYPCSRCHEDRTPDPRERQLTEFHTQKILHHGTLGGWCYRCHTKDNIDRLHLQDGTLVTFDQAFELCGSCHGDKLRDWKAGIHGLTTGWWLGDRQRRSCPFCHDPHNPHFPAMQSEREPSLPRTVSTTEARAPHEESNGEGH